MPKTTKGEKMEFDEIMKAFGERLGLAEFNPNSDGSYGISLDGTVVTFVARHGVGLLDVVARLCDMPDEEPTAGILCRTLLSAMAIADDDEAYSFFISEDRTSFYLRRSVVLCSLDAKELEAVLEGFLETLEDWRHSVGDFFDDLEAVADHHADAATVMPDGDSSEHGFLRV